MPVFFGILGAVILVCVIFVWRARGVRVRREVVSSPFLPDAFDGWNLVVLSDLHDRVFSHGYRDLAAKVADLHPDVILLAGDWHNKGCRRKDCFVLLRLLADIAPTYLVSGNHDPADGSAEGWQYRERIRKTGAVLLDGHAVSLYRGKENVTLVGNGWEGSDLPRTDGFCLYLTHSPDVFDRLLPLPDLMVSGHIHGGFIRLPWIGPVFAPGEGLGLRAWIGGRRFFPKYSRGLYRKGDSVLFVSQGLGYAGFPIRFIPAEIGQILLKKEIEFSKTSCNSQKNMIK